MELLLHLEVVNIERGQTRIFSASQGLKGKVSIFKEKLFSHKLHFILKRKSLNFLELVCLRFNFNVDPVFWVNNV